MIQEADRYKNDLTQYEKAVVSLQKAVEGTPRLECIAWQARVVHY
jgi:hypothetical protein